MTKMNKLAATRSWTALSCLALATLMVAGPAQAGRWVTGGTIDAETRIGVNFVRYLAEVGEAQMMLRCDITNGIWIDAGVTGNGEDPLGESYDAEEATATVVVISGDASDRFELSGSLVTRPDGAVVVSSFGPQNSALAERLLSEADRLDVEIGGHTKSIEAGGLDAKLTSLSQQCEGWGP